MSALEQPGAGVLEALADELALLTPDELDEWLRGLEPADLDVVEQALALVRSRLWRPEPHQVAPGTWERAEVLLWLLMAGRGAGKTDACAYRFNLHMLGPPCDPRLPGGHAGAIIAPTLGDASAACVHGPSGLKAHNPQVHEFTRDGARMLRWPNGAEARLFGVNTKNDVDRLRAGGNRCIAWCEELAAWRYLRTGWDNMRFGLRVGAHPQAMASTTPRPRAHLRRLAKSAETVVVHARTYDNPHNPDMFVRGLESAYAGTRLAAQEIDGVLLEDVEGALYTADLIEENRLNPEDPADAEQLPKSYRRIVVAVDPTTGAGRVGSDECGIVVAGVARRGGVDHGYVLADYSMRGSPEEWAAVVADAFDTWSADVIVAEVNFGAETVHAAMKAISQARKRRYPTKDVRASRGKRVRAEPVLLLDEQGRIHHVGRWPLLEHQMTTWVPGDDETDDEPDAATTSPAPAGAGEGSDDAEELPEVKSPDRLDARVWAFTELMLVNPGGPATLGTAAGRAGGAGRRAGALGSATTRAGRHGRRGPFGHAA